MALFDLNQLKVVNLRMEHLNNSKSLVISNYIFGFLYYTIASDSNKLSKAWLSNTPFLIIASYIGVYSGMCSSKTNPNFFIFHS